MRRISLICLTILTVVLASGCKKSSATPPTETIPAVKPIYTLYRHHFLGSKALAADTNAEPWLRMAEMTDSRKLRDQTLLKLARAPLQLFRHRTASTNDHSALIQPLLHDLLRYESFAEIRGPSNEPAEFVLAVHLEDGPAQTWRTNLATILSDWTGRQQVDSDGEVPGWELKKPSAPQRLRFARVSQWVLVGVEDSKSVLFSDYLKAIESLGAPATNTARNWLEVSVDWPHAQAAFPLHLPFALPQMDLFLTASNENLRTHIEMSCPTSFGLQLEPWAFPTNLIREPLLSFTAAQPTASILQQVPPLSEFKLKSMPNQVYFWSVFGIPFQEYAAALLPYSTGIVRQLAPQLIDWASARIPTNCGALVLTNASLLWTGLVAFAPPHLEPIACDGREYVAMGLGPIVTNTKPAPRQLLAQFIGRTNLLYYDWEITQQKLMQWRFLDDTRYVFFDPSHRPRMRADFATIRWFQNCLTNLGNTVTEIALVRSNHLTLLRKSPIGLTGVELAFLAEWLESPKFPLMGYSLPSLGEGKADSQLTNHK